MPSGADASPIDLSIIIPVFNESQKIAADIRAAVYFCASQELTAEIIIADDGSTDATASAAEVCRPKIAGLFAAAAAGKGRPALAAPELRILPLSPHRGKGFAVRSGMVNSRGRYILFIDSGGCIPWDQICRGLGQVMRGECDIAHASRRLPDSIVVRPQSWPRRLAAWFFRHVFTRLLGLPRDLSDTQAGLKIYRGEPGRSLYRACRTDGFLFDAEIILRACRSGCRICEFPVTWKADPDSRLRLRGLPRDLLREALAIKKRLHREFRSHDTTVS